MSNETKQIEKRGPNPVATIKGYIRNDNIKARFADILGKRSGAFLNSIVNVVRGSAQLQKCTPESVMSASMVAATLNLPIDPVLGQAAIVPYKNQACFQIMYRGVLQLCIRSGQYATIHCSEIYVDELKSHNPITGQVKFKDTSTYKMRYSDKGGDNVIGHYAFFRLVSGFEKAEYMTKAEVMAHAKKYSKAYQYDLKERKATSAWSTDPIAMGNKTVLLKLLKRYGIMSIEMQDALLSDRDTFEEAQEAAAKRIEAEQGSDLVDAEFEPDGDVERDPQTQAKIDKQKAALAEGNKKNTKKKAKKKTAKKNKAQVPAYHCDGCNQNFDEVKAEDKSKGWQCPHCLSWRVFKKSQGDVPEFMDD